MSSRLGRPVPGGIRLLDVLEGDDRIDGHAFYLGVQDELRRTVAVRCFPTPAWHLPQLPRPARRQLRHTTALSHPHLIHTQDYGRHPQGWSYLTAEHVEGSPLAPGSLLERDEGSRLLLAGQFARALAHAHEQGAIHGDLRATDLILTAQGGRLGGFGRALLMDAEAAALPAERDVLALCDLLTAALGPRPGALGELLERARRRPSARGLVRLLDELATPDTPSGAAGAVLWLEARARAALESDQGLLLIIRGPLGVGRSRLLEQLRERLAGEAPGRLLWCDDLCLLPPVALQRRVEQAASIRAGTDPSVLIATLCEQRLAVRPEARSALLPLLLDALDSGLRLAGVAPWVQLRVPPLTPDEGSGLARSLAELDPDLAAAVHRHCAGNPRHISLLCRGLQTPGRLTPGLRGALLAPGVELGRCLPDDALGDLMGLLEEQAGAAQLDDHGQLLLACAAVLGRRFSERQLRRLVRALASEGHTGLLRGYRDRLGALLNAGLLHEDGPEGLRAGHPLLHDALRAALAHDPSSRQIEAHAAALIPADTEDERILARCVHLQRAADAVAERAACLAASAWLARGSRPAEARAALLRALALAEPPTPQSAELRLRAARFALRLGDLADARTHAGRALQGGTPATRLEARLLLSELSRELGLHEEQAQHDRAIRALGRALAPTSPGRARWLVHELGQLYRTDPSRAAELAQTLEGRALPPAEQIECRILAGRAARRLGQSEEGLERLRSALRDARRQQLPWAELSASWWLGRALGPTGQVRDATLLAQRMLALSRRLGDRWWETRALHLSSSLLQTSGEWEAAAQELGTLIGRYTWNRQLRFLASTLLNLGDCQRRAGSLREARGHYLRGLEFYQLLGRPQGIAIALANLGLVELALARPRSAEERFRDVLSRTPAPLPRVGRVVRLALAECLLSDDERDQTEEGRALLDGVLEERSSPDVFEEELGEVLERVGRLIREEDPARATAALDFAAAVFGGLGDEDALLRVRGQLRQLRADQPQPDQA